VKNETIVNNANVTILGENTYIHVSIYTYISKCILTRGGNLTKKVYTNANCEKLSHSQAGAEPGIKADQVQKT
jgi:hypothetical protein